MSEEVSEGLDRRDLLKRGAMVGGALVWTVPAVQTLAGPAFATTSPIGQPCVEKTCSEVVIGPIVIKLRCEPVVGFEGCLCRCAGANVPCSATDPCTIPIVCTPDDTCTIV